MLKTLFIVGMGSFAVGVLRYLLSRCVQGGWVHAFPLGTFVVNVAGCFAIGVFCALSGRAGWMDTHMRLFLTAGLCGGFTTFSTFVNEGFLLLRGGDVLCFWLYAVLSLAVGLAMLYAGYAVVKIF